jgi:hypothetical protein
MNYCIIFHFLNSQRDSRTLLIGIIRSSTISVWDRPSIISSRSWWRLWLRLGLRRNQHRATPGVHAGVQSFGMDQLLTRGK